MKTVEQAPPTSVFTKGDAVPSNKSQRSLASIAVAADAFDVHTCTIRRWIAKGLVTGYRVGPRLIKVDLNELDAVMRPIGGAV